MDLINPFIVQDAVQQAYNNDMTASGFGTGGKYHQAIQAATAAVQGLAGGLVGNSGASAVAGAQSGKAGGEGSWFVNWLEFCNINNKNR